MDNSLTHKVDCRDGKLFLGIIIGIFVFFHPGNVNSVSSTIPSSPVSSSNSIAVENTTVSKPIAHTNKLAWSSSTKSSNHYSEPIQELKYVLQTFDPDEDIILEVKRGDIPQIAVITVTDSWQYVPYKRRLELAQKLQECWAYVYSRENPDSAHIRIVDYLGNRIGGSKVLAGSLIEVD